MSRISAKFATTKNLLMISIFIGATILQSAPPLSAAPADHWLVGTARRDITGPASERGMAGYGNSAQVSAGIHTRLYARAFVFCATETSCNAYLVADLVAITQLVRAKALASIMAKYPTVFREDNVMLSATHTHSAPGGFSTYGLFNSNTKGYDKQYTNSVADGIANAIIQAYESKKPGTVKLVTGHLHGAQFNRSQEAYNNNHDLDPNESANTNTLMTLLTLEALDGEKLGALNWFSLHSTSMERDNLLISADNKGYAAYTWERQQRRQPDSRNFVAGFANSDEGDVSPDIFPNKYTPASPEEQLRRTAQLGTMQRDAAQNLWQQPGQDLPVDVASVFGWTKMPGLQVAAAYTDTKKIESVCAPALGMSFAAGSTEDGPTGLLQFAEGMRADGNYDLDRLYAVLRVLVGGATNREIRDEDYQCQFPKAIAFMADGGIVPWVPTSLPFQIQRIGDLAIVAIPGEMTTQAGRRLRAMIGAQLAESGVTRVVLAGLANSYANYITTYDEYQKQHYEGGATTYGPHTLAAYMQIYSGLADALKRGERLVNADQKPKISEENLIDVDIEPFRDLGKSGEVLRDTSLAKKGNNRYLEATFRASHLSYDYFLEGSFLAIQRQNANGTWSTIASDADPETRLYWNRNAATPLRSRVHSKAKVEWLLPQDATPGSYRIRFRGKAKKGVFEPTYRTYSGTSNPVQVK